MVATSIVPTKATRTAKAISVIKRFAGRERAPMPAWRAPLNEERDYTQALRMIMAKVASAFAPLFDALPSLFDRAAANARDDAWEPAYIGDDAIRRLMADVRARIFDGPSPLFDPAQVAVAARRYATRANEHARTELARQSKAALGVDVKAPESRVPAMIQAFVAENVAIVTSRVHTLVGNIEKDITRALAATRIDRADADDTIQAAPQETPRAIANVLGISNVPAGVDLDALARSIERNVQRGGSTKNLARVLRERFGFESKHAKFVARDQVGKLVGQTNAYRQRQLGIKRFTWRTSRDERVREEHVLREGEVYDYDDPPDGELPGEPINCRCSAEPIFDEVLDEFDANEIPDDGDDIRDEDLVREVSLDDLLARGFYQPADMSAAKLKNAERILAKGALKGKVPDPITILVGPTGRLEVGDGRARLAALINSGRGGTVPIRFKVGTKATGKSTKKAPLDLVNRAIKPPIPVEPKVVEPKREPKPREIEPERAKPERAKPERAKEPKPKREPKPKPAAPPARPAVPSAPAGAMNEVIAGRPFLSQLNLLDMPPGTAGVINATPEFIAARATPKQPTSTVQASIRSAHDSVVAKYGMPNASAGRPDERKFELATDRVMPGADADYSSNTGRVRMNASMANAYSEAVRELAAGVDYGRELDDLLGRSSPTTGARPEDRKRIDEIRQRVNAVRVMNHETIHGHGPGLYNQGMGTFVEEVVTESAARRITNETLGIREGQNIHTVEGGQRGAYGKWVNGTATAIQEVTRSYVSMSDVEAGKALGDASLRYKSYSTNPFADRTRSKRPDEPGARGNVTPEEAVELFIHTIDIPGILESKGVKVSPKEIENMKAHLRTKLNERSRA